jgi:hypothetical protein
MMAVAEDVLKVILAIVGIIVLLYVFISKPAQHRPGIRKRRCWHQ